MVPTHVAMSLALAVIIVVAAPTAAPFVVVVTVVGDVFPDLDIIVGVHRRTLHQAGAFVGGSVRFNAVAIVTGDSLTVAAATGFVAAAPRCTADYLGGNSEVRPRGARTDRGVYIRSLGGWVEPRRLAAYGGFPGDLVPVATLPVPGLLTLGGDLRGVFLASLAVGVTCTLVRKHVPQLSGCASVVIATVVVFYSVLGRCWQQTTTRSADVASISPWD